MKKNISLFFILFFLSCSSAWAQGVAVEAFVDKPSVALDDQVVLTVRVKGANLLTEPQIPNRGNFDVLSRGSSSNVQLINGRLMSSKEFVYVLGPKQAGDFQIGPISVFIEGVEYKAGPIQVHVSASEGSPTLPPASNTPGWNPPSMGGNSPSPTPSAPADGQYKDVFVTAELSNSSPYKGEQIIYIFRLFTSRNMGDAKLELPDFHDFLSEEVQKENKYYKDLGNKRYVVSEHRVALFPLRAGTLNIGQSTVQAQVEEPVQMPGFSDPFFTFRGGDFRPRVFKTSPLQIEVKELPENAPADFKGLVGQFDVETNLSSNQLAVGDSGTLTYTIAGSGNFKDSVFPLNGQIPNLKIYEDKPAVELKKSPNGVFGSKSFKWAIVPEAPGKYQIPASSLSYLDPKKQSYVQLTTPSYEISVVPGTNSEKLNKIQAGAAPQNSPVNSLGEDIATIHPEFNTSLSQQKAHPEALLILFIFPPLIFLGAWFVRRRREWIENNQEELRKKKALTVAIQHLKQVSEDNPKDFAAQMSYFLKEYLGSKWGVVGTALTPREIEKGFSDAKRQTPAVKTFVAFLQELDAWIYGGVPSVKGWQDEARKKAMGILKALEKEF